MASEPSEFVLQLPYALLCSLHATLASVPATHFQKAAHASSKRQHPPAVTSGLQGHSINIDTIVARTYAAVLHRIVKEQPPASMPCAADHRRTCSITDRNGTHISAVEICASLHATARHPLRLHNRNVRHTVTHAFGEVLLLTMLGEAEDALPGYRGISSSCSACCTTAEPVRGVSACSAAIARFAVS